MSALDSTQRFSERVAEYLRSRPGYPARLLEFLSERCGLAPGVLVADVGSGTGILSGLLLERGCRVLAVEPNAEMREAGSRLLGDHPAFASVSGTAESTGLQASSVDMITVAQAFHWFDHSRARAEFARILKPGGWVVLLWNDRRVDTSAFLRGYEGLLVRRCPEYLRVVHRNVTADMIDAFFHPARVHTAVMENSQVLDWDGLVARHESQSYVPRHGREHDDQLTELRGLFLETAQPDGTVVFEYETRAYFGQLPNRSNAADSGPARTCLP
ncbi:MAG: class I SAM-dependent methyltransferase [Betaproteobacteria bacterium]